MPIGALAVTTAGLGFMKKNAKWLLLGGVALALFFGLRKIRRNIKKTDKTAADAWKDAQIRTELEDQIAMIKADPNLSDEEKKKKVENLLMGYGVNPGDEIWKTTLSILFPPAIFLGAMPTWLKKLLGRA